MNVLEQATIYGAESLADADLISTIFGGDYENGLSILKEMSADPRKWTHKNLLELKGCGETKAVQIHSVIELLKRAEKRDNQNPILDSPEKVYRFMRPHTKALEVEKFWVLCLNRKNRLIKMVEHTSGTTSSSLVSVKNVLRSVIESGASAFICCHNHPSLDTSPSIADTKITRSIKEASNLIDFDLLDHIIIGSKKADVMGNGYYSFQESGLI
jgi:DNA repair protein RadC